jgi:diaminopimelate decarboxylase
MNDMPRVAMYGVQEPLFIMNDSEEYCDYAVVGHCCESSDIITSKLYDAETIETRKLRKASI